jgi:hypothetical protein
MLQVGFEPTIPVFEREKAFHALDRAVIVTGDKWSWSPILQHIPFQGGTDTK